MYRVWLFFDFSMKRWEDHYESRTWDSDGHDSDGDSVDSDTMDDWNDSGSALHDEQSDLLRQLTGVEDRKRSDFTSAYAFLYRRIIPWVANVEHAPKRSGQALTVLPG